jgi:hypothetical protein
MSLQYQRSPPVEPFRRFARMLDFLILLAVLRTRGNIPSTWRETFLIELGPGPMRLSALKRAIFKQVYFLDQSDFGIPDPGLRLCDLERWPDAGALVQEICAVPPGERVFLFADHFLEHLSQPQGFALLQSVKDGNFSACFRVPNILSSRGIRNYQHDSTHRTDFNESQRGALGRMGFNTFPWSRWYRGCVRPIKTGTTMHVAEEIVICTCGTKSLGGRRTSDAQETQGQPDPSHFT